MTTNRELDVLIDEITVDCHVEDEQLMGFENAFDEDRSLPCRGTIMGEPVEVIRIGSRDGRRELVATCERAGQRHHIALLDVTLDADPTLTRLVAAYRRWLAAQDGVG